MKNRTVRKRGGACPFAQSNPVMNGGSCGLMSTGQYGASVYGDSTSQQAVPGSGNLIDMKQPPVATVGGGKRKRKGGSTIVDLGVPLVLTGIYASTSRRRRKGSAKKSRRFRRRR